MNPIQDRAAARVAAVDKLYSEARALGLLSESKIRLLLQSLLLEFDANYFRTVLERVEYAKRAELLSPKPLNRFLPTREEAFGEVLLGRVVGTGYPYGLNTSERHFLVLGSTGYGKSTLCRKIQKHLALNKQPFFTFSKKEGDARGVASAFSNNVVLFRLADQNFYYNPKEGGPGVSLLQSNTDFCETFCHAEALLLGSGNYILSALSELDILLETDIDNSRQASIFEIREYVARRKHNAVSRDARFQESILNRLDGLISSIGRVLACSKGFPIEQVLNDGYGIILEVDGVKSEIALLLTSSITLRLFTWMLHSRETKPKALTLFLDDSQELWNVNLERRVDEGLPVMGAMASRFREAGLIVASTQTPRLTSTLLRQNCATKVIFNQNDYEEAVTAARTIGLPESDAGELARLKRGEAVCFKPSYPFPVKVQIDRDIELE